MNALIPGISLGVLAVIALAGRVLGDLASDEVRGWLDIAPRAILRLAAARLDSEERERLYREEWLPELEFIMHEAETRPITRAIRSIGFAFGLLMAARAVSKLRPPPPPVVMAIRAATQFRLPKQSAWDIARVSGYSDMGCKGIHRHRSVRSGVQVLCGTPKECEACQRPDNGWGR